eukprot:Skav214210  [mRNA]  locus=scaffold489:267939:268208:- [translate_table: standard]
MGRASTLRVRTLTDGRPTDFACKPTMHDQEKPWHRHEGCRKVAREKVGRPRELPPYSAWTTLEQLEQTFEKKEQAKKRKLDERKHKAKH